MKKFTHIDIHSKAFLLNEEFSANFDEAERQKKIAEAAPELLEVLKAIYLDTFECGYSDEVVADRAQALLYKLGVLPL